MRGSLVGHGDYIWQAVALMSRLSVSSSNSLRRGSPATARRRARSLGRLGELGEDEPPVYEYQALDRHTELGGATSWQDRVALQRAKSTCQVGPLAEATPPALYARSEGAELRRPTPTSNQRRTLGDGEGGANIRPHLPDLLSSSGQTPRRPHSSYDLKVEGGERG